MSSYGTYTGGTGRYCEPRYARYYLRTNREFLQAARGICEGTNDRSYEGHHGEDNGRGTGGLCDYDKGDKAGTSE